MVLWLVFEQNFIYNPIYNLEISLQKLNEHTALAFVILKMPLLSFANVWNLRSQ